MAEQIDILKLVLDELGMSTSITTMNDRIAIQKAVCMVQEAGLQLGYSFNWYVRGPYSPSLASDYYNLSSMKGGAGKNLVLADFAKLAVEKIKPLISPPADVPLQQVFWMELLASIAYLRRRLRLSDEATRNKIELSKPNLFPHYERARDALASEGLL